MRCLLFLVIFVTPAQAREGLTWSAGAGAAWVEAVDQGATETGLGYLSLAGSLGSFVSSRASLSGRLETTFARTTGGRGMFVVTAGPTAELWATERVVVGAGLSLLVVGVEPYDILISRGLAVPLRAGLRPFDSGFRIALGVTPAFFRDRAILLHTTLLAEWQAW